MSPDEIPHEEGERESEAFILGPPADPDSASERFYSGAVRRIQASTLILTVACTILAVRFGYRAATGLVVGAALSYWNFRSLVTAVTALAGRIVEQHQAASGTSIVFRFIVRIPLIALVAYAILVSSPGMLRGFLAGLCVPVAALLGEAVYEVLAALRRGF